MKSRVDEQSGRKNPRDADIHRRGGKVQEPRRGSPLNVLWSGCELRRLSAFGKPLRPIREVMWYSDYKCERQGNPHPLCVRQQKTCTDSPRDCLGEHRGAPAGDLGPLVRRSSSTCAFECGRVLSQYAKCPNTEERTVDTDGEIPGRPSVEDLSHRASLSPSAVAP